MPLPCDLYLLINEYLGYNTRHALSKINPSFTRIHQKWCTHRAQSLLQRCPFLNYLGLTKITTMLRSGITITYDAEFRSRETIDALFDSYSEDIDDDEYNRDQLKEVLRRMVHRRGISYIPVCLPLFIFDYGYKLVVLDDELNLYVDGKRVLSGVINIDFHKGYLESFVLTEQGEAYDFEDEDEDKDAVRRRYKTGFVNHISGKYHIHDDYYLSDDYEFDMKVSDDPVVLLREGSSPSTCLITCVNSTCRTSYILGIYDNKIVFRSPIPSVRMAIEIKLGYLVLLDDGSCAILRRDIYGDSTHTDVIVQDATYDHISRCEHHIIVARRGEKIYLLEIQGDRVIEEENDGFLPIQGHNGVYRIVY